MLNSFVLCCNFCACKCACTVFVRSPRGGVGDRHLVTVPQGGWGTVFPGVGNDKGRGGGGGGNFFSKKIPQGGLLDQAQVCTLYPPPPPVYGWDIQFS